MLGAQCKQINWKYIVFLSVVCKCSACQTKTSGRKVSGKNLLGCRSCGYSCITVIGIREHVMARHLNYKPYSCPFCSFRAYRGCYVTNHVRFKHPAVLYKNCSCSVERDDAMEELLKNGYYRVSTDDVRMKLQDHTYDGSGSCLPKKMRDRSSQLCRSTKRNRSDGKTTRGALKMTLVRKRLPSVHGTENCYRCEYCPFLTSDVKVLILHVSKKHGELVLKCAYCDVLQHSQSEMFLHWYKYHQQLAFRYHHCSDVESVVEVNTSAASIKAMMHKFQNLGTSADFDGNVPATEISSKEADAATSDTPSSEGVDDVIYCCETCPASFSTSEALSVHNCSSSLQQATV